MRPLRRAGLDKCRPPSRLPGLEPLTHEDALYRARPGLLQQRLAALAARGVRATPAHRVPPSGVAPLKAQTVQPYASQLRALGLDSADDTARPGRYWTLEAMADRPPRMASACQLLTDAHCLDDIHEEVNKYKEHSPRVCANLVVRRPGHLVAAKARRPAACSPSR